MTLTDVLDLLGALLIVAGIAAGVAIVCVPAALVVAGIGVLVASYLADRASSQQRKRATK